MTDQQRIAKVLDELSGWQSAKVKWLIRAGEVAKKLNEEAKRDVA